MKILVVADIHGSNNGIDAVLQIAQRERAQKTVFCGDLFGGWGDLATVAKKAESIDSILYFVRGNNDSPQYDCLLNGSVERNVVMYHFNRKLFFTHGDVYSGWNIPPILKSGDAVIYGHTHIGSLTFRNGLFALNVGSVSRPRDGKANYLVLDESGATLKDLLGNVIYHLDWSETQLR